MAKARIPILRCFRFRVCSSSFRSRSSCSSSSSSSSIKYANRVEYSSSNGGDNVNEGAEIGNKIMVVVDSSLEAKGALEWALSHTVQAQDTLLLLLHVAKPSAGGESDAKLYLKGYQVLQNLKNMCESKRPEVQVKTAMVEGKEKGAAIVEEAKQRKVSLLVIGQRKRATLWCMMKRWVRKRGKGTSGVVDYCIQNAACMTIAVRRKNKKLGGYLITTKRHKNFWLLA